MVIDFNLCKVRGFYCEFSLVRISVMYFIWRSEGESCER